MNRLIAALLLMVSAASMADEPKANPFDLFDELGATPKAQAEPLHDKRVRACILKNIGEAKVSDAVVLVYRVCLAEYGYH